MMAPDGTESVEEKIVRLTRERNKAMEDLDGERGDWIQQSADYQKAIRKRESALRDAEDRLELVQCFRANGNEDHVDAALHGWTRKTERSNG